MEENKDEKETKEKKMKCCERLVYDELIRPYSTKKSKEESFKERSRTGTSMSERSLIYGEIEFDPFSEALKKIEKEYGGLRSQDGKLRFVDLGSGTGKAVFAAALCHPFEVCSGVEIVKSLHDIAVKMLKDFEKNVRNSTRVPSFVKNTKIELVCGDATKFDLSNIDLVFMCSTVFDFALMSKLARAAGVMRVGTFMITLSKDLPCANWKVLERSTRFASWGGATVIIQRKMRDGHVPKSKYFCRREDASYKPAGSKSIFDEIKELKGLTKKV